MRGEPRAGKGLTITAIRVLRLPARSFAKRGYSREMLARPMRHRRRRQADQKGSACAELVEAVKRGVLGAGGLPLEFPTISLGEVFLTPTSLVFRNLMAMDVEEMIRAQPMNSVVLVGGCDKTGPAHVMGAISAGVPAVHLVVGRCDGLRGERLRSTECRRLFGAIPSGFVTGARSTTSKTLASRGPAQSWEGKPDGLLSRPGTSLPEGRGAGVHAIACEYRSERWEAVRLPLGTPTQQLSTSERSTTRCACCCHRGSTNGVIHLAPLRPRGLTVACHLKRAQRDERFS